MAINFPTSLDVFTDPSASDQLNLPSHSGQHTDLNNAVEALEAKVGADGSAVTTSHDYKIAQLEARTSGKILQVVSTTKTDTFSASVAATSFSANVTGLEVSITPSSTSSNILIYVVVHAAQDTDYGYSEFRLMRDATAVGVGDLAGVRKQVTAVGGAGSNEGNDQANMTGIFLDSPSTTSAITYGVQVHNRAGATRSLYVNRSSSDVNAAGLGRPVSTIMVMEVSA